MPNKSHSCLKIFQCLLVDLRKGGGGQKKDYPKSDLQDPAQLACLPSSILPCAPVTSRFPVSAAPAAFQCPRGHMLGSPFTHLLLPILQNPVYTVTCSKKTAFNFQTKLCQIPHYTFLGILSSFASFLLHVIVYFIVGCLSPARKNTFVEGSSF